jgi:alpha-glucosidase (family GH31 glycosyl hydrolase)
MEPLATPRTPSTASSQTFGALARRDRGLEWRQGDRTVIEGMRLWIREGTAADQLIQITEGVVITERLGPAIGIEPTRTPSVGMAEGRHVRVEAREMGPGHLRLTVEPADDVLRIGVSWPLAAAEHISGAGCRHGLRFDQAGRLIDLGADRRYTGPDCPPDMIEAGGVPMGDYVPVPWLISSRGWGAWVECDGPGVQFDLQADVSISVRAASGPLRLHLFDGPRPGALLRRYCRMTGFPQLLPEWAYGHWKSRDVYEHERDVLEDFDGYLEHDLPLDAIVLDSPWETQYNTWEFNPWQFPDAPALIRKMRRRGVRTVVWTTPWVNIESVDGQRPPDAASERSHRLPASNYEEGRRAGHYVRGEDGSAYVARWWMGTGSPVDLTSATARRWWIEQARSVLRLGVEGIKADDGEGYYFPPEAKFSDGRSGAEAAWAYPRLYRETMQEALDAEHPGSGVLFARSGAAGAQGPGLVWGGDQVSDFWSLQTLLNATLTAAASAISNWSHDVGGYLGHRLVERCDPELFVRWAQFGAFTPLMQAHGRFDQEGWTYGREVLDIFRETVLLHERLVPYILAAAATARRTGLPIIRPLALVDPEDERGWTISDAYMFGPSMWVAPVVEEGAERRRAYLPRGRWIDFWNGAAVEGGRDVVVPAPLNRIPVWVREGAIVVSHPCEAVSEGLGEDGISTRPLEATLWGRPTCGRATARLADDTRIRWQWGEWSVDAPPGAPEREIRFAG